MMAIRKLTISYCLLLLFACGTIAAQPIDKGHKALAERTSRFGSTKLSADGRWLVAGLVYPINTDTLLVFSCGSRSKLLGARAKTRAPLFIGRESLLVCSPAGAELWNLNKGNSIFFEGALRAEALDGGKRFLLHYGSSFGYKLVLYDASGKTLQAIANAKDSRVIAGAIAVTSLRETDSTCGVWLMNALGKKKLYTTPLDIENMKGGPDDPGLLIFERNASNGMQEVIYLDTTNGSTFPLKELLALEFTSGSCETLPGKEGYYLRLTSSAATQESLVDIWYGSDTSLQSKFVNAGTESHFIWQPREKKIRRIGDGAFPQYISLGDGRYFLGLDPDALQDYTSAFPNLAVSACDAKENRCSFLDTLHSEVYVSAAENHILSQKDGSWQLYDLFDGAKSTIGDSSCIRPYFTENGKGVLFEGKDGLRYYNFAKATLAVLEGTAGWDTKLMNGDSRELQVHGFYSCSAAMGEPLLIRLRDPVRGLTSYLQWHDGKAKVLIPPTSLHITQLRYDAAMRKIAYAEEDFNLPPRLVFKELGQDKKIVFCTNKQDLGAVALRREVIRYSDGNGNRLQGVLFYPAGYKSSASYPLVVHVYENQGHHKSRYLTLSYQDPQGFNTRAFVEGGYFVFFPDIAYSPKGPGVAALDAVNHALDAVLGSAIGIDSLRMGLIGHSFGGYETNFIATSSNRFKAYISGSANSDIVNRYHSFNYDLYAPEFWRFENGQFKMRQAFSQNKELYYRNNPLYNADKVAAPMLLWTGLEDKNIRSEETRTFYNALRRNNKKVIALFYKNEGHTLEGLDAQYDLCVRMLQWFDYFLKDDMSISWIGQEMRKGAE